MRQTRATAWIVLIAIAVGQAWMFRNEVSPDGVAYLDLSDAVVRGRLGELVNGYWSPLYPALIGLARILLAPTPLGAPEHEFAIVHVVNVIAFVLALAAFEWLVRALNESIARASGGRHPLGSALACAVSYALVGLGTLAMIEVKGTVPDLLVAAICFGAFASALRLRDEPTDRKSALALGALLGAGALAKSIMFPVAGVILLTLALPAARRGGLSRVALAAGTLAAVTLPWIVALSISLGRPTLGANGALNYSWWVNDTPSPQDGHVPAAAAPTEPLPLDSLAVLPNARGTNPLWYDPTRWQQDARRPFSWAKQRTRLWKSAQYYAYVTAPFLLALAGVAASVSWRDLRATFERASPVLFPSIAAIGAYSLVFTTSRYIAPFLVAGSLAAAAAFPAEARIEARRFMLALIVTAITLDAVAPLRGRILLAFGLVLALAAFLVWRRRTLDEPATQSALRRAIALGVVVTAAVPALLMGGAAIGRARGADPHPQWTIARRLMQGVPAGSKVAVLGSPSQVGWARLARYQIVAVIPTHRVAAFKALGDPERRRVVEAFQRAGAVQLVDLTGGTVDAR